LEQSLEADENARSRQGEHGGKRQGPTAQASDGELWDGPPQRPDGQDDAAVDEHGQHQIPRPGERRERGGNAHQAGDEQAAVDCGARFLEVCRSHARSAEREAQGSGMISTKPPGTTSISNLCPAISRIPNSGSFPTADTSTARQVPPHATSAAKMSN